MATSKNEQVESIMESVREQLFAKGSKGLSAVARTFKQADFNGNKKLDQEEFEEAMSFCSVFLKKREISLLFKVFDRDGDGNINYEELLRTLAPPLSDTRKSIVKRAFKVLDRDGSGVVNFQEVKDIYNASKHPDVQQGRATAEQVTKVFLNGFEGKVRGEQVDGKISEAEFMSYYEDLSASIPSDEYFVQMMESCWMIRREGKDPSREKLATLVSLLKKKVAQKTKSGKNPADTLTNVFKHFDADESGKVTADEFNHAMERFGISLERADTRAFFQMFDKDNSGTITTKEFANGIYSNDE